MARPADESLLGRVVAGRYVVESYLGGGAMGGVYRARRVEIDKPVAIKILHRELVAEPTFVSRFKREAKAASLLDHPNSVRVIDYGQEPDGLCFIVMDLLGGKSLFTIIRDEWPVARDRIVELIRQTLAALAVAHDQGIVHRDLKPENILVHESVDDEGRATEVAKVCDFGMAKMTPSREEAVEKGSEMLTSHGVVVGTPEYMSPEQGRGEPLDGRSDLYSVGVILYQLLAGALPFHGETAVSVLLKHLTEDPVPPSKLAPNADPGLEAICLKAMSKRRDDRYASAREMRAELQAVLSVEELPLVHSSRHVKVQAGGRASAEADTVAVPVDTVRGAASAVSTVRTFRESSVPPPPKRSRAPLVVGLLLAIGGVAAAVAFSRAQRADLRASPPASAAEIAPLPPAPTSASATPLASAPPRASASASAMPSASAPATAFASVAVTPTSPLVAIPTGGATAMLPPPSPTGTELLMPVSPQTPQTPQTPDVPPSASASSGSFASARVMLGGARCDRAGASDVLAAMPVGRFTQCYRDGLRAQSNLGGGSASLHLEIEADGFVSQASFAGPEQLAGVGRCIARSAAGRQIRSYQTGSGGSADVDLVLKAE